MTQNGREKLRAYGIAPPVKTACGPVDRSDRVPPMQQRQRLNESVNLAPPPAKHFTSARTAVSHSITLNAYDS